MDIIVGGGRFGVEAAEYLRKHGREFVIVDKDRNCYAVKKLRLKRGLGEEECFVEGDMNVVVELIEKLNPELVFPTAPLHIAAELARVKFNLHPWLEFVDCILSGLPPRVVISAGRGSVVVSYNRDQDCLPKCPSPDICPVTKIKKPCPMYELVGYANPEGFVLVSHQLEPGLGALKGSELRKFLNWAERKDRFTIATACRCHGVITALKRTEKI
jgi:hypothetical protein